VPLNTWSFLVGTYDGSTIRMYVNGTEVGSKVVTHPLLAGAGTLAIGRQFAAEDRDFDGLIAEPAIFNRALSVGEIQAQYHAVFTVTSSGDNGGVNPAPFAGTGTLRQAIIDANATPGAETIAFALPWNDQYHFYYKDDGVSGSVSLANVVPVPTVALDGVTPITSDLQLENPALVGAGNTIDPDWAHSWWSITPQSYLPSIDNSVILDGYTQPGAGPNMLSQGDNAVLRVELDGSRLLAGNTARSVLTVTADNSAIRGLVINRYSAPGDTYITAVWVKGGHGDHVEGNFLGTDVSGTRAPNTPDPLNSNGTYGVLLSNGAQQNVIGGDGDPAARNLMSGNTYGMVTTGYADGYPGGGGVPVSQLSGDNQIVGNFIGTDATGKQALPNYWDGIGLQGAAHDDAISGNIISGNRLGIVLGAGYNSTIDGVYGTKVVGNLIGPGVDGQALTNLVTDAQGNAVSEPEGNLAAGVLVQIGTHDCQIGGPGALANVIAYNGSSDYPSGPGVWVSPARAVPEDITIQGNSIHDNAGLGIDLGGSFPNPDGVTLNDPQNAGGPNRGQYFPVLTSACSSSTSTFVSGTFDEAAEPNTTIRIEFFANQEADPTGYGEGQTFLGWAQVTTDANGHVTFSAANEYAASTGTAGGLDPCPAGQAVLSATATNLSTGDTSEFSQDLAVPVNVQAGSNASLSEGTPFSRNGSFTVPAGQACTATVNYGDGTSTQALALSGTAFTLNHLYGDEGTYPVTVSVSDTDGTGTATFQITVNAVSPGTSAIAGPASALPGQPLTYTAAYTNGGALDTDTAVWNWGDGTTTTVAIGGASGTIGASHVYAATQGTPYVVSLTVTSDDALSAPVQTFSVAVLPSTFVLSATANGALSLSGNAALKTAGVVVVDSNSGSALSAGGSSSVSASAIQVVGQVQRTGNASFSVTPTTHAASVPDPLGTLPGLASAPGFNLGALTIYGARSYSGTGSYTLQPGIYSRISASGNVQLTLSPGLYLIEGGGFTVTGGVSLTGQGVTIYNAGSNFPQSGGNLGGLTLGGTGSFSLTAATAGPYPGVVLFQARDNTRALALSGNAVVGVTGTIYAPAAQVVVGGNAQLTAPLVVNTLTLSGNGASTQVADGGTGSPLDTASSGTLLAGDLAVYVNDPTGLFTAAEQARIQDAIASWDSLLTPYSVVITEVSDPSLANVVIDTGSTSAAGSAADGVLGSYSSSGEITLLQGWNWYDGANPSQIGAGQYDFQTVVTHELGHALGLGGSPDPGSPMYEILASGTVHRTPTAADLNISEPDAGADPERAAGFPVQPAPRDVRAVSDTVAVIPLKVSPHGDTPTLGSRPADAAGPASLLFVDIVLPAGVRGSEVSAGPAHHRPTLEASSLLPQAGVLGGFVGLDWTKAGLQEADPARLPASSDATERAVAAERVDWETVHPWRQATAVYFAQRDDGRGDADEAAFVSSGRLAVARPAADSVAALAALALLVEGIKPTLPRATDTDPGSHRYGTRSKRSV
jgi:parallel beta-helix repeat protein